MKKLPHERLRDASKNFGEKHCECFPKFVGAKCMDFPTCDNCVEYVMKVLANGIEKYYDPKPRDTEGNPVYRGMEVAGGIVETWRVFGDGSWGILDSERIVIQSGACNEFIRLPEPKVLDADGVEIKVGDTVYNLHDKSCRKATVVYIEPIPNDENHDFCVKCVYSPKEEGYDISKFPENLTHREPDSIQRLQQFAVDHAAYADGSERDAFMEIADRLTALMGRDA